MSTAVSNVGFGGAALPQVWGGGVLEEGDSIVVADTEANVVAALGGPRAVGRRFRLRQVPSGGSGEVTPAAEAGLATYTPQAPAGWVSPPTTVAGGLDSLSVRCKYLTAQVEGDVHMKVASRGLDALSALAGGSIQAVANARAEVIRAALLGHMAGVGTAGVDGEHRVADAALAATLAAVATLTPSSNLAASITLVNALLVAAAAHGDSSGVHFHDDATLAAATITVDPPVTLANVVTDLNDLLAAVAAHLARGAA